METTYTHVAWGGRGASGRWRCRIGGNPCYLAYLAWSWLFWYAHDLGCVSTHTHLGSSEAYGEDDASQRASTTCGQRQWLSWSHSDRWLLRRLFVAAGLLWGTPLNPPPGRVQMHEEPALDEDSHTEWYQGKKALRWQLLLQASVYCQQLLLHVLCFKPVQEVWYPQRGVVFTDGKYIRMRDIHDYRMSLGFEAVNVMLAARTVASAFNLPSWSCSSIAICCFFQPLARHPSTRLYPRKRGGQIARMQRQTRQRHAAWSCFSNGNNMIVETICTWGCSTFGFVEYHLVFVFPGSWWWWLAASTALATGALPDAVRGHTSHTTLISCLTESKDDNSGWSGKSSGSSSSWYNHVPWLHALVVPPWVAGVTLLGFQADGSNDWNDNDENWQYTKRSEWWATRDDAWFEACVVRLVC